MKYLVLAAFLSFSVAACDQHVGPPLEISNVTVFAPLPGTHAAVAYMTMTNNTHADIVINSISSPQFASVMLHETKIVDGVARMAMLRMLLVPAESSVLLGDGGKHIMLMKPIQPVELKQTIALHIDYDIDGLIIVSTTVQSRFDHE